MNPLFKKLPQLFQSLLISIYNLRGNKAKFSGSYKLHKDNFFSNNGLSLDELKEIQKRRYSELIDYANVHSTFYSKCLSGISKVNQLEKIKEIPVLHKKEFAENLEEIYTISKGEAGIAKTGGTTGKSLTVRMSHDNTKERFALLDNFRHSFGYQLGEKTAWFSGKDLINELDIKKNRFWKTDHYHHVRYYSTFHMKTEYLNYYIEDIKAYKPKFLSGFPSSIAEIAKYGLKQKIDFPAGIVKAVFTTSETITPEIRYNIETFFKTDVYDQYSASEGAPFIFECKEHNLHMELQSGVFEVLDDHDQDADEGRLIITSFTSYGTPLIRYDIGDRVKLSAKTCTCGNNNPLVDKILGRIDDFIYSPKHGKINLQNISNSLKDVKGVMNMQIVQDELDSITVKLVVDELLFSKIMREKLISNIRGRIGNEMKITIERVDDLPVEKSGKYRLIKNNIKHLV